MSEQPAADIAEDVPAPVEALHENGLRPDFVREVKAAIDAEREDRALELAQDLHAADLADLIEQVGGDYRGDLVRLLGPAFDAEVLSELDFSVREELLESLEPGTLASAVVELETDDAVDILEDLEDEQQRQVLAAIPESERRAIVEALSYPEESAGRLMQRDLIAVPEFWSVGQTIDHLRENQDLTNEFWEIFVVDPAYKPVGTLRLSSLLRSPRPVLVKDIMSLEQTLIPVDMDQEQVAFRFQQYHLISAAVIDGDGRLVGQITVDDIVDVINEEAGEDILALAGVSEGDFSESVITTTRSRLTWLVANLATAILASLVIAMFDQSIEKLVALAILMPIVASMGGNAGTQTMTVTVRALATNQLTGANAMRILSREVKVSLINGALFAVLMGGLGTLWFQNIALGVVLGIAMIINLLAAGVSGMLVPLALDRLKVDPAVASSVFVTTVTDVIGFFAFLGLAALLLL